jgi:hypothetical protein
MTIDWIEHTEAYADGSPSGGPFSSPKAHHSGDSTHQADLLDSAP